MGSEPQLQPSFSPRRKWGIGINVTLIILTVFSVVVMVNYLGREYFYRFHLSSRTKVELSPLTLKLLSSLTNRVKVTLYYDQDEPFYSTVAALLNEYSLANPRITIETIDYLRDAAAAQRIKAQYKLALPSATNLVIFECEGRPMVIDGNGLTQYTLEPVPNEKEREFRRKPVEFQGEKMFTSALLWVSNPKPLNACFLEGHGEHSIERDDKDYGYLDFASIARQNNIQPQSLSLLGTNPVPQDCHLLVVAGPQTPFSSLELEKIEQYLSQGGRVLALFNFLSLNRDTGLEKVFSRWGIDIGTNAVIDLQNTITKSDLVVTDFSKNPMVNPLLGLSLHMLQPRSISRMPPVAPSADPPHAEELAFSGAQAFLKSDPGHRRRIPLMVAAEKGAIKGINERGSTRILVVGDSFLFSNDLIASAANRDFAGYALNWLLDRTQLLESLGPRPITEYRLVMTAAQMQKTRWLLLGGMPGAILLLGGLVWIRRRK